MEQYISIKRIFTTLNRNYKFELNEADIVEWTGEALRFMRVNQLKPVEHVVFAEVENYHTDIPNFTRGIVQIARDNYYNVADTPSEDSGCTCDTIDDSDITLCSCDAQNAGHPDGGIPIDGNGSPLVVYDVAYYRPIFDVQYEHFGWRNSGLYERKYSPIRLSNHTFFNSIVCEEDNHIVNNCNGDEYTIIEGRKLRFNFKEGRVAMSLLKNPIDEDGYPKIYDDEAVIKAIEWYIVWQQSNMLWFSGVDGMERKAQKAEEQWQWYCNQAKGNMKMIAGVDRLQNFLDQRQQMLPKRQRYDNWFGNLNKRESKIFNRVNETYATFYRNNNRRRV